MAATTGMPVASRREPVSSVDTLRVYAAALYPVLAVLGKLASFTVTESYFSHKRNLFNVLFVKLGWAWTTAAFWAHHYLQWQEHKNSPNTTLRPLRFSQTLARYVAATAWWVFFTQWCLGAPLMDRIFLWTGGGCYVSAPADEARYSALYTSRACRTGGGSWQGGHDPSGHFFLLVHGSLLLWMEIAPNIYQALRSTSGRLPLSTCIPLALLALWAWMFLMTSIYFHLFAEKLTGLVFGYVEVFVVYYLGRFNKWGVLFGTDLADLAAEVGLLALDVDAHARTVPEPRTSPPPGDASTAPGSE